MFTGKVMVFRVDSSLNIGTGHVMRCLTLADALKEAGAVCQFIMKDLEGNSADFVKNKGYDCSLITPTENAIENNNNCLLLGESQIQDAKSFLGCLVGISPDWIIVDNYFLDAEWESRVKGKNSRVMVIDDLANRYHECDVLLDQNLGRNDLDYKPWLKKECRKLFGPEYSLLRKEFSHNRTESLNRRVDNKLGKILISMGGIDKENVTSLVLKALSFIDFPSTIQITVVMGTKAPCIEQVRKCAQLLPWQSQVLVGVNDMAQLMSSHDIAIGAAGSTAWERCALGMPAVMVVVADNQKVIAQELESHDAAWVIWHPEEISTRLPVIIKSLTTDPKLLSRYSLTSAKLTDGKGTQRVVKCMEDLI